MGRWGSPRSLQTISTSMSFLSFAVVRRLIPVFFFFKQKTAYEIGQRLEFRRVLFRSSSAMARACVTCSRERRYGETPCVASSFRVLECTADRLADPLELSGHPVPRQ